MLVNAKQILEEAKRLSYAVPQFNINNLEWTRYILEESQSLKSPVILGVSEGAAKYFGGFRTVYNVVSSLIDDLNITIPVVLHLDHGSSVEFCQKAIEEGFTSVMIDASQYDIDKNILITNQVIEYAKSKNVSVEAEVGHIGGTEDNVKGNVLHATVEDCEKIVEETNLDFLAPALGSVHGLYKGKPNLNFSRMLEIKEKTKVPLVLHGGTGIDDKNIIQAIKHGICKININTDLQIEWSKKVRKFLIKNKKIYDPRKIISSGEEAIKNKVREKIILFGSVNKI